MSRMTGRDEASARRVKLTYDDYVLFPDDGMRHELIDGEHFVTPAPNRRHQELLGRIHGALYPWLERHPVGLVLLSPFDVVFTPHDVVEPDILFVAREHEVDWLSSANASCVDLAIEIASPSTRRRDQTIKRDLYERAGVAEYWFVDPDAHLVHVYRRESGTFGEPSMMSPENHTVLTTPLLPGFELSLRTLFR
jgi:Uma2 family endonuclease